MAEQKKRKRWIGDFRAYEGKKIGWSNKSNAALGQKYKGGSGWKYENGKWVQYRQGAKTGRTEKHRLTTTHARGLGIGSLARVGLRLPTEKQKAEAAKLREEVKARKAKRESLKNKNQPKANKTTKPDTPTKKSDALKISDKDKAAWLKKTRNSPAAKSGAFSDDHRWELQKKHRAWKAKRKRR